MMAENIQRPTSNAQHRSQNLNWTFGVGRSAFSVSDHQIETNLVPEGNVHITRGLHDLAVGRDQL